MKKKRRGCGKFLLTVLFLLLLIRCALYDGVTVRRYAVTDERVEDSHTYVVVTDLHATLYGEGQGDLIEQILAQSPEAVFLVGDIADDKRDFEPTRQLLAGLKDKIPCYYVTGNHERWLSYTDDVAALFAECGATVLDGESVLLPGNIRLWGVSDPLFYDGETEFLEALSAMKPEDEVFDLLLSHRPEYAESYAAAGFDLTLSGHAHGGQVRIPLFLNGLYAPGQGWMPDYAGGRYEVGKMILIVSRGLMRDDLPRVFNPPELVVIQIHPQSSEK